MMRRKKKQLERDGQAAEDKEKTDMELAESDKGKAEEVNTGRIDLNSDPYNKEEIEAVALEKEESRKRGIGQCSDVAQDGDVLEVKELEGEAEKIREEPRGSS